MKIGSPAAPPDAHNYDNC